MFSCCTLWFDTCAYDKYIWWKTLLNCTSEIYVLNNLYHRKQGNKHLENHGRSSRGLWAWTRWRWDCIMRCSWVPKGKARLCGSTSQLLFIRNIFAVCQGIQKCLLILMTSYMMLHMWFLINLCSPLLSFTFSLLWIFSAGPKLSI